MRARCPQRASIAGDETRPHGHTVAATNLSRNPIAPVHEGVGHLLAQLGFDHLAEPAEPGSPPLPRRAGRANPSRKRGASPTRTTRTGSRPAAWCRRPRPSAPPAVPPLRGVAGPHRRRSPRASVARCCATGFWPRPAGAVGAGRSAARCASAALRTGSARSSVLRIRQRHRAAARSRAPLTCRGRTPREGPASGISMGGNPASGRRGQVAHELRDVGGPQPEAAS